MWTFEDEYLSQLQNFLKDDAEHFAWLTHTIARDLEEELQFWREEMAREKEMKDAYRTMVAANPELADKGTGAARHRAEERRFLRNWNMYRPRFPIGPKRVVVVANCIRSWAQSLADGFPYEAPFQVRADLTCVANFPAPFFDFQEKGARALLIHKGADRLVYAARGLAFVSWGWAQVYYCPVCQKLTVKWDHQKANGCSAKCRVKVSKEKTKAAKASGNK